MSLISGFIIVKNGERTIERSLASLARVCDQIVVVDTGSTDATKEIVARFTASSGGAAVQMFDFAWIDDFSAARNFAVSKCTGEWIVYLDADDEMDEASCARLKKILQESSDDVPGYSIPYQYSSERVLYVPRAFRRELGLHFMMPIHEFLNIPTDVQKKWRVCSDVLVTHLKQSDDNESSLMRNVAILSKALERESDSADVNSLNHLRFFLARDLYAMGNYDGALPYFEALLKNSEGLESSFLYLVHLHRGRCLQYLKRYDEAISAYQKTFEAYNRFCEPLIYQADIFLYQKHDPVRARELYEKACTVSLPQSSFPVEISLYHDYPVAQLKKISRLDKPIMLVCGYYGKMNFGDELILESIIQHFPNHRIIVASYDVGLTQALHEIESVPYGGVAFGQALSLASCVVIGGGGLFHDQGLSENKTIDLYCDIIRKAATAKKKVFLVGVGVDTIVLPENQRMIAENFPLCDGIFVRDDASKEHVISCGMSGDLIHVVPDLVFDLDVAALSTSTNITQEKNEKKSSRKPRIGLNLCLPVRNSKVDLLAQIDSLLVPFLKKYSGVYDFFFIPFAPGDRDYIPYLEEKTGVKLSVFTFTSSTRKAYFEQYIRALDECDALIGSRYHFLIAGMLLGKSTYGLSYSEKTSSLIQLFSPHVQKFNGEISLKHAEKIILNPLQLSIRDMVMYIEKT